MGKKKKNNHHPGFFVRRAVIEGFLSRRGSVKIKLTRLVRLRVAILRASGASCYRIKPGTVANPPPPPLTLLRRTRKNDGKSRDGNENRC